MPDGVTNLIYRCRICDKFFDTEQKALSHIRGSPRGRHADVGGDDANQYIEVRQPEFPDVDMEWRRENIFEVADGYRSTEVPAQEVAEKLDVPKSQVVYELRDLGYTPLDQGGNRVSRVNTSWEDLTEKQRGTLLATAFFPSWSHEKIAESNVSPAKYQSDVSKIWRDYSWMLAHPDVETPIMPSEESESKGTMNTVGSTSDMLEAAKEEEEAAEVADSTGSGGGVDGEDGTPDGHRVTLDEDLAFSILQALIETEREEEARTFQTKVMQNE